LPVGLSLVGCSFQFGRTSTFRPPLHTRAERGDIDVIGVVINANDRFVPTLMIETGHGEPADTQLAHVAERHWRAVGLFGRRFDVSNAIRADDAALRTHGDGVAQLPSQDCNAKSGGGVMTERRFVVWHNTKTPHGDASWAVMDQMIYVRTQYGSKATRSAAARRKAWSNCWPMN